MNGYEDFGQEPNMHDPIDNLRRMVRWNDMDALAVATQNLVRVEQAQRDGKIVGVLVVLVTADAKGNLYEPAFSNLPAEVASWGADALKRRVIEVYGT